MTRTGAAGLGAVLGFLAGASLAKPRPTPGELSRMGVEELEAVDPVRVVGGLLGAAGGALAGWILAAPSSASGVSGWREVGPCQSEGYRIMHCDIYNCPSSWGCGPDGVQICEELRVRCPGYFSG